MRVPVICVKYMFLANIPLRSRDRAVSLRARIRTAIFPPGGNEKSSLCKCEETRVSREMNQITRALDKSFSMIHNLLLGLFRLAIHCRNLSRGDSSRPENRRRSQGRSIRGRRCKPLNFARKQSRTTDRHRNVQLNHFPRAISDTIKPPGGGWVARGERRDERSGIVRLIFSRVRFLRCAARQITDWTNKSLPVLERYSTLLKIT